MSLLINNSRDIGNKFLFGHFMMNENHGKLEFPMVLSVEKIAEKTQKDMRASQIMILKNKVAICAYNNASRHNAYVYTVDMNGDHEVTLAHEDAHRETIGYSKKTVKLTDGTKAFILPSEDGQKYPILYIDYKTGEVGSLGESKNAPGEYSVVAIKGVAYFADPRGDETIHNFYDVVDSTTEKLEVDLPHKAGIVFGMVKHENNYICACDQDANGGDEGPYYGLMSTQGWTVEGSIPEVCFAGKKLIAFYRDGTVKTVDPDTGEVLKKIGNTKHKARRACNDPNTDFCYWVTHGPQQLWVTNGKKCKKLHNFGGDKVENAAEEGSAFSSAVALKDSDEIYVVVTKKGNNGWELYKVKLLLVF